MVAPDHIPLASTIHNPAVPETLLPSPSHTSPLVAYHQRTTNTPRSQHIGVGPERNFISIWDHREAQPGFPARPSPGSVLDLDAVYEQCDLTTNKVSEGRLNQAHGSMSATAWNFCG